MRTDSGSALRDADGRAGGADLGRRRLRRMTLFLAKLIWGLGVIGWFAIRYEHQRRSRKTPKLRRADSARERLLLTGSILGMLVAPLAYIVFNQPKFANYP